MQRAVGLAQVFDGEQCAAVERRQELHARVDRLKRDAARAVRLADDDRARAAIALGAAFFGAGAARVFAQILKDGARGRRAAHFADRVAVIKADRLGHDECLAGLHGFLLVARGAQPVAVRFGPGIFGIVRPPRWFESYHRQNAEPIADIA